MSNADVQAVKDGADLNQVVNAHRGMSTAAGRKVTSEAMTRRGYAGQLLRGNTRLMPEQIYREAAGNRQEAIRLLRAHGFIF
jgi:phage tail tape-measure protein